MVYIGSYKVVIARNRSGCEARPKQTRRFLALLAMTALSNLFYALSKIGSGFCYPIILQEKSPRQNTSQISQDTSNSMMPFI
jgi:hypothetical protein